MEMKNTAQHHSKHHSNHHDHHEHDHSSHEAKLPETKLAKFLVYIVQPMLLLYFIYVIFVMTTKINNDALKTSIMPYIIIPLVTIVLFGFGFNYLKVYQKLLQRKFDMDFLIALSTHSAFIYSFINTLLHINDNPYTYDAFWEVATILIIVSNFGKILETKLQNKVLRNYKSLLKMQSPEVLKFQDQKWIKVDTKSVIKNDHLLIKKGERIPVDGFVFKGESLIDEASLTGESKLRFVKKGDKLISGTVNKEDNIEMIVEKPLSESTVTLIINRVSQVALEKPKIQRISDKIARLFIPSALLLAVISFTIWSLIGAFGSYPSWIPQASKWWDVSILAAVVLLAIACPCAFGIATPLAITTALSEAFDNNILLSNLKILEQNMNDFKVIAFDKTGTLTKGKPEVINYNGDSKYLAIIKALEINSKHPIAEGIVKYTKSVEAVTIDKFKNIINKGVEGYYQNDYYEIQSYYKTSKANQDLFKNAKTEKISTLLAVLKNGTTVATIELIDPLRNNVKQIIQRFRDLNFKTVLITGDNEIAGNEMAKTLNVNFVYSDTKPDQKANIIKDLQSKHGKVLYLGDGINDIIALKQADLSISFSSDNDFVSSVSDVVLFKNDFESVLKTVMIAKTIRTGIKVNFLWAIGFNLIVVPLALTMLIFTIAWISGIFMVLSSTLLIINSMLLKWFLHRRLKSIDKN